jgi:hypothetical protein
MWLCEGGVLQAGYKAILSNVKRAATCLQRAAGFDALGSLDEEILETAPEIK